MKHKSKLTAVDVLREVIYYLHWIEMLNLKLKEVRGELYTVPTVKYDKEKINGGIRTDLGDKVITVQEGGESIEEQIGRYQRRYDKALQALRAVPSFPHVQLLDLRYFKDKSWSEVARFMGLSESHVRGTMHREAVAMFKKSWDKLTQVTSKK